MEHNELVKQIAAKVLEKISTMEETPIVEGLNCEELSQKPKSIVLEKRVITQKDVRKVHEQHIEKVCVGEDTIITDLAREYAEEKGISFMVD